MFLYINCNSHISIEISFIIYKSPSAALHSSIIINPLVPSVLNIGRLTKISISIQDRILKKISYERRAYESVDEKSLS